MSTENTPAAPSPAPAAPPPAAAPVGALSAAQVSSAREAWISQGLDPATFDAAMSESPPSDPAADLPAVETLNDLKQPGLSVQQAQEMARALIDSGMSPEAVKAALEADGYSEEAQDTRTEAQVEFDRAFGSEHPSPEAYHIDWRDRLPGADLATVVETNSQASTWCSEVGLHPSVGASLIETAFDAGNAFANMTPAQQSLYKAEQTALLSRVAGSPERAQLLVSAAAYAAKQGNQAFQDRLHAAGGLHSAEVILLLANHGMRLVTREELAR